MPQRHLATALVGWLLVGLTSCGGAGPTDDAADDHHDDIGFGSPAPEGSAGRTIHIEAGAPTRFTPALLAGTPGEVIDLRFTSTDDVEHMVAVGAATMHDALADELVAMTDAERRAYSDPALIRIPPGEMVTLTWRVGVAPAMFACHVPGHLEAGMRGEIAVVLQRTPTTGRW